MQACHQKSLRACALTENASSQDQPGFGDQHRALCEMLQQLQLTGTLEGWPHLNGVTLSPSWVILSVDWILVYDQNCSPFPFICDNQKVQINSNANTPKNNIWIIIYHSKGYPYFFWAKMPPCTCLTSLLHLFLTIIFFLPRADFLNYEISELRKN